MVIRSTSIAVLLVTATFATRALHAQQIQYVEENGVKYQVVTQTSARPISQTHYEPREYTTYREHYTTDLHESVRTYQVPVTENQWVPGYQRSLNIFAPPVLSYRLMPVTRWETRVETVRVPVTRRDLLPEKHVQQVPVVTQHLAEETHVHRIPIGPAGGNGSFVADRSGAIGGTRLEGDPPKGEWKGNQ
jgi:hypothetical protein